MHSATKSNTSPCCINRYYKKTSSMPCILFLQKKVLRLGGIKKDRGLKKCPATRHGGTRGREEVQLLLILNLGTRWGWVVNITPRPRFTSGERIPGTQGIGGWVGPRAGLDAGAGRKILCLCQESNPGRPFGSQTLYCLSYRGSSLQVSQLNLYVIPITSMRSICPAISSSLIWRP
jgi:hypothetical protein